MMRLLKRAVHGIFDAFGYRIEKKSDPLANFDRQARETIRMVSPYSMIGPDRLFALIEAVRYIARNGIDGDFVECGVWRGGAVMAVARTAGECGIAPAIWLYDTFEGMSTPTEEDKDFQNKSAESYSDELGEDWCRAGEDEVARNLKLVDYQSDKWVIVKGLVEDTIPARVPERIAFLRLDTDWYESTAHELSHLYDRLVERGVLIIDDYGDWQGCKKAVDEFFASRGLHPYLVPSGGHRIYIKQ